jgi:hypothetical protein
MTLDVDEFIRRFLIHVLPRGFHRIRHYGLFAGSNRAETIKDVREFLKSPHLRPKRLRPRRPIRHSRSHALALAAAAACSSSRPSNPAASHVTSRPHLSSQSGSTPHDREHYLPRHRVPVALVINRQRCCAAQ